LNEYLRFHSLLTDILDSSDRNNLGLISAGIAFFALLSLFPTLAAIVMVWSFFCRPGAAQRPAFAGG
jgi:membrane protein